MIQMREAHAEEAAGLRRKYQDLQEQMQREITERDERIRGFEVILEEQATTARVSEFLPHASRVMRFLDTLPPLAGPSGYGVEVVAPVWALRCVRSTASAGSGNPARGGAPNVRSDDNSPTGAGKDTRELLELFELFEQLSNGRVTPMELTESKPLDVYVHRGEDDAWGLYCCSRHRLLALLMRQACARNEFITVRCILRSKDDCGYWGWHWNSFYDGSDGLNVHPSPSTARLPASAGTFGSGALQCGGGAERAVSRTINYTGVASASATIAASLGGTAVSATSPSALRPMSPSTTGAHTRAPSPRFVAGGAGGGGSGSAGGSAARAPRTSRGSGASPSGTSALGPGGRGLGTGFVAAPMARVGGASAAIAASASSRSGGAASSPRDGGDGLPGSPHGGVGRAGGGAEDAGYPRSPPRFSAAGRGRGAGAAGGGTGGGRTVPPALDLAATGSVVRPAAAVWPPPAPSSPRSPRGGPKAIIAGQLAAVPLAAPGGAEVEEGCPRLL